MNEGQWKVESTQVFFLFTKKNARICGGLNRILLFFGNRMEYFRVFQLKLTTCYNSFKYFHFPKKNVITIPLK